MQDKELEVARAMLEEVLESATAAPTQQSAQTKSAGIVVHGNVHIDSLVQHFA